MKAGPSKVPHFREGWTGGKGYTQGQSSIFLTPEVGKRQSTSITGFRSGSTQLWKKTQSSCQIPNHTPLFNISRLIPHSPSQSWNSHGGWLKDQVDQTVYDFPKHTTQHASSPYGGGTVHLLSLLNRKSYDCHDPCGLGRSAGVRECFVFQERETRKLWLNVVSAGVKFRVPWWLQLSYEALRGRWLQLLDPRERCDFGFVKKVGKARGLKPGR
jgi:hypothetical protein